MVNPPERDDMENDNGGGRNAYQKAQQERWANMSQKERDDMSKAMQDGRRKAKARRRLTSKKTKAALSNTFLLCDKLAEVYVLAGGREQVIRLLDIVELVNEEGN